MSRDILSIERKCVDLANAGETENCVNRVFSLPTCLLVALFSLFGTYRGLYLYNRCSSSDNGDFSRLFLASSDLANLFWRVFRRLSHSFANLPTSARLLGRARHANATADVLEVFLALPRPTSLAIGQIFQ